MKKMRVIIIGVSLVVTLLSTSCRFGELYLNFGQFSETVKHYGYLDVNATQNFPPLQNIITQTDPTKPVYGLFTWTSTWSPERPFANNIDLANVGWRVIRVGSSYSTLIDDDDMSNLAHYCDRYDAEVMYTLVSTQRFNYGAFLDENNDNAFIDDFLVYLDNMLNRFGPNGAFFIENPDVPYKPILYYEIYNEPNLFYMVGADYWTELNQDQKADLYGRLLVRVYNHVRSNSNWDDVKIVGIAGSRGGLTRNGNATSFTELVHQKIAERGNDPANCYDIVSTHPYIFDGPPDVDYVLVNSYYQYSIPNNTAEIRRVMDLYGNRNKPIWFTEVGWHRFEGAFDPYIREFFVSDRLQAAYVVRLYLISMRIGVERVHIMFVWDTNGFNGGFFNNDDGSWWEQTFAVQTLIDVMPNPKLTGSISDGIKGYYCYIFNPDIYTANDDDVVVVAWNVEGPITVEIPLSVGEYRIINLLGGERRIKNDSDKITITIGPCPTYIVKR